MPPREPVEDRLELAILGAFDAGSFVDTASAMLGSGLKSGMNAGSKL